MKPCGKLDLELKHMELKSLLHPKAKHIFIKFGDLVRAYPIAHVEDHALYFLAESEFTDKPTQGYFIARNNEGIVLFENPNPEMLPYRPDAVLYRIITDELNYSVTNRRLYQRVEFAEFRPLMFRYYGDHIVGHMVNISEGGIRMNLDRSIELNTICHFEIRLTQDFTFKTDGVVVRSGYSDDSKKQAVIGIHFLAPAFRSDEEKVSYQQDQKKLSDYLKRLRAQN